MTSRAPLTGALHGLTLPWLLVLGGAARPQAPAPAAPPSAAVAVPPPVEPLEPYVEAIPGTSVRFEMVPVPAGTFLMGSPPGEPGRRDDEGPQVSVALPAFWMSRLEITWNEYDLFAVARRGDAPPPPAPPGADAVTRPTPPYADESFGYSKGRQPVLSVPHHAAMEYCRWLSERTGRTYRLPTEAEWEYACRAGSTSAYSGGDLPAAVDESGFSRANADEHPHPVGRKKANAWGLFDMHGNVAEWVLDRYEPGAYASWVRSAGAGPVAAPVVLPDATRYPNVVRGGSWDEPREKLRCAARGFSEAAWNRRDPQRPQSIWWLTDATHVGFRVVRPASAQDKLIGLRSAVTRQSP